MTNFIKKRGLVGEKSKMTSSWEEQLTEWMTESGYKKRFKAQI